MAEAADPAGAALAALREVEEWAGRVAEGGGADASAPGPLERLRGGMSRLADEWAGIDDADGFHYYMAARTAEVAAACLIERLGAAGGGGARAAAEGALAVAPAARGVAAGARPGGPCPPDRIMGLTRELMSAARGAGLPCGAAWERMAPMDARTKGEIYDRMMEHIGIPVEQGAWPAARRAVDGEAAERPPGGPALSDPRGHRHFRATRRRAAAEP